MEQKESQNQKKNMPPVRDTEVKVQVPQELWEQVAEALLFSAGDSIALVHIAKTLGENKRPGQILVAFAAETENALENARGKRTRKNADLIVVNDVMRPGAGFAGDTNIVSILSENEETEYPVMSKRAVAGVILDNVQRVFVCRSRRS